MVHIPRLYFASANIQSIAGFLCDVTENIFSYPVYIALCIGCIMMRSKFAHEALAGIKMMVYQELMNWSDDHILLIELILSNTSLYAHDHGF